MFVSAFLTLYKITSLSNYRAYHTFYDMEKKGTNQSTDITKIGFKQGQLLPINSEKVYRKIVDIIKEYGI